MNLNRSTCSRGFGMTLSTHLTLVYINYHNKSTIQNNQNLKTQLYLINMTLQVEYPLPIITSPSFLLGHLFHVVHKNCTY